MPEIEAMKGNPDGKWMGQSIYFIKSSDLISRFLELIFLRECFQKV